VLSDPKKRSVYDAWAKELQFRYVQGVAAKVWRLNPAGKPGAFMYTCACNRSVPGESMMPTYRSMAVRACYWISLMPWACTAMQTHS
jgi:hypothetical protein